LRTSKFKITEYIRVPIILNVLWNKDVSDNEAERIVNENRNNLRMYLNTYMNINCSDCTPMVVYDKGEIVGSLRVEVGKEQEEEIMDFNYSYN